MVTRRRGSESAVLGLCVWLAAFSASAEGVADESSGRVSVPAPLRVSAEDLRARFGEALHRVEIPIPKTPLEEILDSTRPPLAEDPDRRDRAPGQTRLERSVGGDVRTIQYDLADDRVYRVRWQLSERFERPLMDDVVSRVSRRLGRPDYDQTLRARPGSARADLRRTGWTRDQRIVEIRQLHPVLGGPLFLSVGDERALQAIVDGRGVPLPQPDTADAWWRRPQRAPSLPTQAEREALAKAIDALVASLATLPGAQAPAQPLP